MASSRRRSQTSIREAAWQSAAASGVAKAPFGAPPLSSQAASAASRRQLAAKNTPARSTTGHDRKAAKLKEASVVAGATRAEAKPAGPNGGGKPISPAEFDRLIGE